jgi:putative nucleotidyltransferase with HDIG domain
MHQLLVHSQAVARAAQRLAREIDLPRSDDLLTVALLHDVGKLVMVEAQHGGLSTSDQDSVTPEVRVQQERRLTGLDHAAVGGLLLTRWGLPKQLAEAVALHHRAERDTNLAVLVRLADMVAHHAHGDAVDRKLMLRLAATCEVSVEALRDVLFDLPRVGGSRRRRAERSPLSTRETAVLRRLAEGKVYKQIGDDLGLSTSTVRTHLHNIYAKLGVTDRAQAVLLATEMAWL